MINSTHLEALTYPPRKHDHSAIEVLHQIMIPFNIIAFLWTGEQQRLRIMRKRMI